MFVLIALAQAVDQSKYRQCKDSVFCARNRFVSPQKWTAIASEANLTDDLFTIPLQDGTYSNVFTLSIVFLHSNMLHFKITPAIPESFTRFDCSSVPSIVNQTLTGTRLSMTKTISTGRISLSSGSSRVDLFLSPFRADFFDGNVRRLSINPDDTAIFESNLDERDHSELWEHATFGGYDETLQDGPSSVAMGFRFDGAGTRLSGLPAHTLNLTLGSTCQKKSAISDPIRFFNTDINRFEIGSPMAMYGAIPCVVAHDRGTSCVLFWCNPSETWVDVESEEKAVRFISESGLIDFFLTYGTHNSAIKSYTDLTGRPAMPQQFALGYHQCRWTYYTSDELREVAAGLDKALIPHDALWMDLDHTNGKRWFTFDPKGYPDVAQMTTEFMRSRRRVVAQVDPHLKVDTGYRQYVEARDAGYLLKTADGSDFVGQCWPGKSGWVDFSEPAARKWWGDQFAYDKYVGSSRHMFTWNDMNEPSVFEQPDSSVPRDTLHADGFEDRAVHNLYGHFMISATYEGHLTRNGLIPERPFVLTRSYFAGSQKFAWMWTGDNTASWDQLRNSIPQVLSLGICAFPYAGADVGGFFDSPDPELLTRWYQLGAFCYPFFRCHCHHLSAKREPFRLPATFMPVARKAICERYELLWLWYTASRTCFDTGQPIVRPLWWEFAEADAQDLETQLLISDSLLVAPVLESSVKSWPIYLPPNARWFDYRTFAEVSPTGHIQVVISDTADVPAYIRGGRIIPIKRTKRKSSELMEHDPFELVVALDGDGTAEGRLYVDDGRTFAYEKGEFVYKRFVFTGSELTASDFGASDAKSPFVTACRTAIEKIVIVGLGKVLKKATDAKGKTLRLEARGQVVAIAKPSLLVKDDWKITFTY
jgi:alpha 1,3-glucosidase